MSSLTVIEKRKLEKLFEMGGGYVLDFSNRTLRELVLDATGKDIYDPTYHYESGSKANRLRSFWTKEPDHAVAVLLDALLDYARELDREQPLIDECSDITERIRGSAPAQLIEPIDPSADIRDVESPVKPVEEPALANKPEEGPAQVCSPFSPSTVPDHMRKEDSAAESMTRDSLFPPEAPKIVRHVSWFYEVLKKSPLTIVVILALLSGAGVFALWWKERAVDVIWPRPDPGAPAVKADIPTSSLPLEKEIKPSLTSAPRQTSPTPSEHRIRPIRPGASYSHVRVTAATACCIVQDQDHIYYLLGPNDSFVPSLAAYGDAILQPGTIHGGTEAYDIVADLDRWLPIVRGSSVTAVGAIARIRQSTRWSASPIDGLPFAGVAESVELGDLVTVLSWAGNLEKVVTKPRANLVINWTDPKTVVERIIVIDELEPSQRGRPAQHWGAYSGAPVVTADRRLVGMVADIASMLRLNSTLGTEMYVVPMERILTKLEVELVTK